VDEEFVRKVLIVCHFGTLFANALADLEQSLPPDSTARSVRGRPVVVPTSIQVKEVLRLRHANGRLGMRVIGERVGLSWHVVQRILAENTASEKPAETSEKPSGE
jgi:hypothetical protein